MKYMRYNDMIVLFFNLCLITFMASACTKIDLRPLIDNIQFSKVAFLKLSRVSDQLLGVEKSFNKKVVEQDGRRSLLKV